MDAEVYHALDEVFNNTCIKFFHIFKPLFVLLLSVFCSPFRSCWLEVWQKEREIREREREKERKRQRERNRETDIERERESNRRQETNELWDREANARFFYMV